MKTETQSGSKLDLFRHTLATVAYRTGKAVRNAPNSFASFDSGEGSRTPVQILAHLGDLFDWALSIAERKQAWHDSKPLGWESEIERFFSSLKRFDDFLVSGKAGAVPLEQLFQGPVADALTHTGQLAMLRRMAGVRMKSENYFQAEITAGRLGADQANPKREF
jgi:hypothetical protein